VYACKLKWEPALTRLMESIDPVRTGSHKGGDLVISQLIPFTIGLARLIQGLLVVVFKMGGLLDIVVESLQGIPKLSLLSR